MNTAEALQELKIELNELSKRLEDYYGELPDNPFTDEEYMSIIKGGLRLMPTADIFTDEERAFFYQIDEADLDGRQLLSDLIEEKKQIEKAEKNDRFYESPIRLMSLSDIMAENANSIDDVNDIITQIVELKSLATGIGWPRYEALLHKQYRRTMSEIRAIVKELKVVSLLETDKLKLDFPSGLHIQFETDYYKAESLMMLPDAPSFEAVEEMLRVLLYHHKKALIISEYSTSELDTQIKNKCKSLAKSNNVRLDDDISQSVFTPSFDTYTFTKDIVSRELTTLNHKEEKPIPQELQVPGKKEKQEVTTFVTIAFEELADAGNGLEKLKSLDNIDKALLNAITSVWQSAYNADAIHNGEAVTTLQTLYRIMTKNPNSRLDSPEKEKELVDRLMRLTTTSLIINAEAEFGAYPELKKQRTRLERGGSLAQIVVDRATVNGNTVYNAVRISNHHRTPLYTYAKLKNQLVSVPLKLLDTKASNKNNETIAIEEYLIDRIEAEKTLANGILIDTILDNVGIHEKDYKNFKKKRSEVVKKIDKLLAGYVSTGYIKKYKFQAGHRRPYYKVFIYK